MSPSRLVAVALAVLFVATATDARAFCTIAGGCEPVAVGTLEIAFEGPNGKPEPAPFTVYPEKAPPAPENAVATGRAGSAVELTTGRYDVALHSRHTLWERGVAIAENRTTRLALGGYGRLVVSGGEAAGRDVVVYAAGAKRVADSIVAVGKTGEPLPLLAGTYDVRAAMNPDIWFEKVRVARGATSELRVPEPARLLVTLVDPDGKLLSTFVRLYAPGQRKDHVASGDTNTPLKVLPGRYDVQVLLMIEPPVWFEGVEVTPRGTTKLDVPQRGRVLVKIVDPQGKPVSLRGVDGYYWFHPPGKTSSIANGQVGQPVIIGPGAYDINPLAGGKRTVRRIEVRPGRTTMLEIVAK